MEPGGCGSVSESDIAGTGAVHIEVAGGTLCSPPPTLGLTIRVEGRRQCFTSRDEKDVRDGKAVKRSVVAVVKF